MPSHRTAPTSRRVLGRAAILLRQAAGAPRPAYAHAAPGYDSWLAHFYGGELAALDQSCAGAGPEAFSRFAGLDADLWALLLTKRYELYPNIRALLPDLPEPALQELWTGTSGEPLAAQSLAFYRKLVARYGEHSDAALGGSSVLDFGCGWGRLTRFLARDVPVGCLFGCDPVQQILDVCRATRVPAILARSDFVPDRLPFERSFDLAFSFSVFTHLSEPTHLACLRALHAGLRPGGMLVVTVRPPDYLELSELMRGPLASLGSDPSIALEQPRYLFVAHPTAPLQHPEEAGEVTYGEAVITMPYVRERWSELFELVGVDLLLGDLHQVMLTLRRR